MISFQSFFFYFHRQTSQYTAIVLKCRKMPPNMLSATVNELDVLPVVMYVDSSSKLYPAYLQLQTIQISIKTLFDDKISKSTSKPFSKLYILFHLFSRFFFNNLCLHVISYCANMYRCIIRNMSKGLFN